jgi:hypothetical protein
MKKEHQVDLHLYKNDVFLAVIECKAYLDSCYYERACHDFHLFRKFGYPVKHYVFALEDSICEETKLFLDYQNDHICTEVFYLLDGKRSSSKPIYDRTFKKDINPKKLMSFLETLKALLVDTI